MLAGQCGRRPARARPGARSEAAALPLAAAAAFPLLRSSLTVAAVSSCIGSFCVAILKAISLVSPYLIKINLAHPRRLLDTTPEPREGERRRRQRRLGKPHRWQRLETSSMYSDGPSGLSPMPWSLYRLMQLIRGLTDRFTIKYH